MVRNVLVLKDKKGIVIIWVFTLRGIGEGVKVDMSVFFIKAVALTLEVSICQDLLQFVSITCTVHRICKGMLGYVRICWHRGSRVNPCQINKVLAAWLPIWLIFIL